MNENIFQYHLDCSDQNALIMIKNSRGSYFFSRFEDGESPVFKIKQAKGNHLQLIVMEVLYPEPLYREENSYQSILRAIHDGMAVVKETDSTISFTMNSNYKTERIDLREVDCINRLSVKSSVSVECICNENCEGIVEVGPRQGSKRYRFFITEEATHGRVELDQKKGTWVYIGRSNRAVKDTFNITVWDGLGAYATQSISISCQCGSKPIEPDILDVNVVNCPLVRLKEPVEVDGRVSIKGVRPIDGALPVTGDFNFNFPTIIDVTLSSEVSIQGITPVNGALPVTGIIDLAPDATVSISGTPTVLIDQPIEITGAFNFNFPTTIDVTLSSEVSIQGITPVNGALPVTGAVDLAPDATVSISGTPTFLIDQPIEVTGFVGISGISTVLIDQPVEVTGFVELTGTPTVSISGLTLVDGALPVAISGVSVLDGAMTITGVIDLDPDATVFISGTPTVLIDQPIEVTGFVGISGIPTVLIDQPVEVTGFVGISGIPTVSISGLTLVDGALPVAISGVSVLDGAITITGVIDLDPDATVSISGTPTVLIDQPIEITGFVGISGIPTVLIDQPVEVTGFVELTGTPTVSISGLTLVDGALPVAISGVSVLDGAMTITGVIDLDPDATVSISGAPTVLIDQPIEITGFVGISGIPTVLIDQPVEITGFVELTGDPTVSISGLTLVDGALPVDISGVSVLDGAITITGVIDLAPDATVSISGTPTVLIDEPIEVTGFVGISGVPTVLIDQPIAITTTTPIPITFTGDLTGAGFTSILVTTFTETGLIVVGVNETTPGIDVSQFEWYTYAIYGESPLLGVYTLVATDEVAAIDSDGFYISTGNVATVITAIGAMTGGYIQENPPILQYSRLNLLVTGGVALGSASFTIYLQGKL